MTDLPEPDRYAPGELVLGKYRLERKLGQGGMGSVWAAHHVQLDTAVAIKLIRSEANREALGPRLLQEARAAARLRHPAIVRVFDVGQTALGDPFIVMELLEGESLQGLLEREMRVPAANAVQLLLPIADALRAAHAKGIVHRDIKPDNVFLVRDETSVQPKLVDFGIAKFQERPIDTSITEKGTILGSPDYMSPEQARGEESIDHRADVWSFCVLLYEVVCGGPPFDAPNYHALLRAIVEATPPTLESLVAADAELSAIVERGMAKLPADRWPSIQALGEALAGWLLKQGVFEDAAGGSLETKWMNRRDSTNGREGRASFGSLPEIGSHSGLSRTNPLSLTERRIVGEAPTSVGPVASVPPPRSKRRLLLPLALLAAAALALVLRPHGTPKVGQATTSAPLAAPVRGAALPTVAAAAEPPPVEQPPPEVESSEPSATVPTSKSPPRRVDRAPRPRASAAPKAQPGLDLMSPY